MEYRNLGNTGLKVSPLCLGSMQFGWSANEEDSFKVMNKAWDAGINFFDTANVYSYWSDKSYAGKTEKIIGKWLKKSGIRDDLVLASKVRGQMSPGPNNVGLSRRHILQQINASLDRLKTKWIDVYQSHSFDATVPIRETLEIYNKLINDGKINYIGASNYPAWRLVESILVAEKYNLIGYQTLQPYYSLVRRHRFEPDLMEVCEKYNLGVIPYSPLAAGFLTGKYRRGKDLPVSERSSGVQSRYFKDRGFNILEKFEEICKNKEISMAQGAIAWVLHQNTITSPIIGANTEAQLEENLLALDVNYTPDELRQLDEVSSIESNLIIK